MQVLVDALTFTDRARYWNEWVNELGLDCLNWEVSKPRYQFTFHLYTKGIQVYQSGDPGDYDRMCCIELSGTGCRLLETVNPNFDWLSFLLRLGSDPAIHVSRLDIAGDETEGLLQFKKLFQYTMNRKFITRSRSCEVIMSPMGSKEEVQFGSPQSNTLLRIYNKALERGLTDDTHWTRAEFQFRNDSAQSFLNNLANHQSIGATYSGVLMNYLRFTSAPPDANRNNSRIPSVGWWRDFCQAAERISNLYAPGLEYNRERMERNAKSYRSTFKTMLAVNGGNVDELVEFINAADLRQDQQDFIDKVTKK